MKKHTCNEIEPILPATAAGALDPEDEIAIHEHLAECRFCLAKLLEYEETVIQMAYAVPQVPPPSGLRNQIVAIAVQRTTVVTEIVAPPFQSRGSGVPEPAVATQSTNPLIAAFGGLYRRVAPAALAFSVLLLFFSGTALFSMNSEISLMRDDVASATAIKNVMAADGVSKMDLSSKVGSNKVSGQVIMAPGKDEVVVMANHLPALSAGRSYRLLLLRRNQDPVMAGKVKVDSNGVAMCTVDVPIDPATAEGAALAEESDGAQTTQGEVVLEGWK